MTTRESIEQVKNDFGVDKPISFRTEKYGFFLACRAKSAWIHLTHEAMNKQATLSVDSSGFPVITILN